MPHATWAQTNFNAGEWSPLAQGRADLAAYRNALDLCQGYLPTIQGSLTRRSGTRYAAFVKDSTYAPRLRRFEFSVTQAYMIELGAGYIRFYANEGQLQNTGVPVEVSTPYSITEVWDLTFTQSADTLYISHQKYPTKKLQRVSAYVWTLTDISPLDGPYLLVNATSTTLTPSDTSGTITVEASATTGINGGAGFRFSDVGRVIRIKADNTWLWGNITAFTDATHVSVELQNSGETASAPSLASATSSWRLGVWNSTDGYPGCVVFHQDRLCFGGAPSWPGRVDCSNTGDYENFAPSESDGTVVDSNALSFSLNSGTVNAIRWLSSDEWGLLAGTAGGEWVVAPSNTQTAITPTNVFAKPLGAYGSHTVAPIRVGKSTLYVQRTKRKLRELVYEFTVSTFQEPDLSALAEHLTKSGVKQMAVQLAPQQIVWLARNDGVLVGITYDRDQKANGWHRHYIGGYSDAAHTVPAIVESLDVIPAPGIDRDEVWMVVNRWVNGAVQRTIEYTTKLWEDGDTLANAVFLDGSAAYSGTPTMTVSGLMWAKGETVGVLADGANHPDCVVDSTGEITLQWPASVVQVGWKYKSAVRTLRPEAGGADGPAQGKFQRTVRIILRFFQSLGLRLASTEPGVETYPIPFRTSGDLMGEPPSLFDGDRRESYESTWDTDGRIYFETTDPTPSNITLLAAQLETQDGQ